MLFQHTIGLRFSPVLAALVIALGLLALSFMVSSEENPLPPLPVKVAFADKGHGTPTRSSTLTATPSSTAQPQVEETEEGNGMAGTDYMGSMHQAGAKPTSKSHSAEESSQQTPAAQTSTPHAEMERSDNHEDEESKGSEEMDMSEDHEDTATDDHESAGAEDEDVLPHGTEYEGPSDLVRNIVLGGFAGINGSVLLAAAILKKKNPKKDRSRVTPNRSAGTASPTRTLGGTNSVTTTSITGEVSTVSISLEAAPPTLPVDVPVDVSVAQGSLRGVPTDDAITTPDTTDTADTTDTTDTTAGGPAPEGDDLA